MCDVRIDESEFGEGENRVETSVDVKCDGEPPDREEPL